MSDKFASLGLKPELIKNLEELNFSSMTPIQAKSLPFILEGKDVLAQAKTGSGKTAAFGLGILNYLDVKNTRPQALILCPTRELADQVATEIRKLARMLRNVKVLTLCGGTSEYHQEKSLAHGAHIIVGTPGRVLRLLKKDILRIDTANKFVLDEADRMLDMGFYDDIMDIMDDLPDETQTLLFSATYPKEIEELSTNIQYDAQSVKVDVDHEESTIEQTFYEVKTHLDKDEALLRILGKYQPDRLIVFCKMKHTVDSVARMLKKNGISAAGIHGDLEQNERTAVLTKFSNRSLSILVATDVAARGLDISDLAAVINFDLPTDPEIYIHRVGRTGRAGKKGQAFSLYIEKNQFRLAGIEELTGMKCELEDISELADVESYNQVPPMETMYIGGGKRDKLRPGDIVGAITGEAKQDFSVIGDINIFIILSYVAIQKEFINEVIDKLSSGKIKNRKFKVGQA